jgi:hypothetical protein
MKYLYTFIIICLSISNSFSSFDAYETLYKAKFNLKNGNDITGYFRYFNYDIAPKYTFSNDDFLVFLKKESKDTNDTIEVYSKLQNLNILNTNFPDYKFSSVVKKDLYRFNINQIINVEFISGCKCETSDKNCIVIKEFNQNEISKIQSGEVKFIHSISDPNGVLSPESGNLHIVIGKAGSISNGDFEKKINLLYLKKDFFYDFDIPKYILLKEELRRKGILLLTLNVTDYSISSYLILN